MKIRRYYLKQAIELGQVQGIHGILLVNLKWQIREYEFHLFYPSEELIITDIDELQTAVKNRGKPDCVLANFTSEAGDILELRTCETDAVVIEVDARGADPDQVLVMLEPILGLKRLDEVPTGLNIRSAFIAHAFDDEGRQYASEISHFLDLLNIKNESGRTFSPQSVAQKVRQQLAKHDMFVAILTPQDDPTWLIQECSAASVSNKPVFLLKRDDAQFKSGLLGDLEFIPFSKGQISKTFVHILEGLKAVQ
jgi:hypothetical protein